MEEVKLDILEFYSELFRCSSFDREPDNDLYYGQIFKVNSGRYRYYWALKRNCVTAVINALEYGISDRLEATSYYMYDKVNEKGNTLLQLLSVDPGLTVTQLAEQMNVSRKTVASLLKKLKENGTIERVGSDRKGYWKIIKAKENS